MTKRILLKNNILILFIGFILFGCATGYHKEGFTGGYTESQLQNDVFKVSFRGNAFISREELQDYLFLRCAEITIEKGFDYFVILDEASYNEVSSYTTPTQMNSQSSTHGSGSYSGSLYGNSIHGTGTYSGQTYGSATIAGGQTHHFSKPRSTCIIRCFKGERPKDLPQSFTAYELIGYLKDKVR